MNKYEFGKYIKDLRLKKELRIRDVEKLSDVSNAYLSLMERGERGIPSPDILKKIAPVLGVTYTELMQMAGYIYEDSENFKMDSELPNEFKDLGIDYLIVTREMKEGGLTPDDVRKVLKAARMIKNRNV